MKLIYFPEIEEYIGVSDDASIEDSESTVCKQHYDTCFGIGRSVTPTRRGRIARRSRASIGCDESSGNIIPFFAPADVSSLQPKPYTLKGVKLECEEVG